MGPTLRSIRLIHLFSMGFVWGCQSDIPLSDSDSAVSSVPIDVTIALERSAAMPTVYVLSVESDEPTYLHTMFVQQEGAVRSLRSGRSRFHEHTIWGLKPEMETQIDIDVSNDQGSIRTESWVKTTGSLGAALPQFSLNTTSPDLDDGFLLTSVLGGHRGVALVDRDGALNWWLEEPEEGLLVSRAYLSLDGTSILYSSYDVSLSESEGKDRAWIHRVGLNGQPIESIEISGMSHDFVELPDGALAYIAADWREIDGRMVRGNQVVERALDGTTRVVFSAWDHFDFDNSQVESATGWTHANALDYLAEHDAYLFGIRNLGSVVWIDRSTGAVKWTFGGGESDFDWLGDGLLPRKQHQFDWLGDGLLVFDNRDSEERSTRVVEYDLNIDRMEASQRWEYAPTALHCYALGDVARLGSGHTQVVWSMLGTVEHVDSDGNVHWQLQTPLGIALGYSDWLSDIDGGAAVYGD